MKKPSRQDDNSDHPSDRRSGASKRVLTLAELALWRAVTAHVKPRKTGSPRKASRASEQDPSARLKVANTKDKPNKTSVRPKAPDNGAEPRQPTPKEQQPKPLVSIDHRMKRELIKGRLQIDARLDLHGFTAIEAHKRLVDFLTNAQRDGARMALIVTGKGGRIKPDDYSNGFGSATGVLKRQAPLWLADPRLRHIVGGFSESAQGHGGAGALYVRIRRRS